MLKNNYTPKKNFIQLTDIILIRNWPKIILVVYPASGYPALVLGYRYPVGPDNGFDVRLKTRYPANYPTGLGFLGRADTYRYIRPTGYERNIFGPSLILFPKKVKKIVDILTVFFCPRLRQLLFEKSTAVPTEMITRTDNPIWHE